MRLPSNILSVAILLATSAIASVSAQQKACNGYAALCAKPYNQLVSACAHNAYAVSPKNAASLAANQNNNIPTQLEDGIRAFMLDAYNLPSGATNDIALCHSSCALLDGGLLSTALGQIKSFMDKNPNEVITILWENSQNLAPEHFQAVYEAAGLVRLSHTQAVGDTTWPTLTQMIASGKRLVSFIDSGASASVPWLMSEYDFVFETPYSIMKGSPYPCTIDRPKDQRKQLYVLNHFVSGQLTLGSNVIPIPQGAIANITNADELADHVKNCKTTFKQVANFIAVDFYDKGDIFKVVAEANNVKWSGKTANASSPTARVGDGASKGGENSAGTVAFDAMLVWTAAMAAISLALV
ncbi:hypothetical protein BGZ94_001242 [Podila epigama]|nr:hypothetical protein BGZ94_001242 [Podila epigama]